LFLLLAFLVLFSGAVVVVFVVAAAAAAAAATLEPSNVIINARGSSPFLGPELRAACPLLRSADLANCFVSLLLRVLYYL
jgi:hypothetical protein